MSNADKAAKRPQVRVVAGLVVTPERDRFLVTQRLPDDPGFADHWEFPGGKVEPGESDREALARELREELAIEVDVGPTWLRIEQQQEQRLIDFRVLPCTITAAEPRPVEVQDLRWVTVEQAGQLLLPPLDQAVLEHIQANGLVIPGIPA